MVEDVKTSSCMVYCFKKRNRNKRGRIYEGQSSKVYIEIAAEIFPILIFTIFNDL